MKRLIRFLLMGLSIGCFAARSGASTVAYYRFEEGTPGDAATGTGTVLDSSGNGFNGNPMSSPLYSSNVPVATIPQTGAPDNVSMHFSGSNVQSVFVPDNPAFDLTQSLTIEAYFNVAAIPNVAGAIVYRGDSRPGLDPYFMTVQTGANNTKTIQFGFYNAANQETSLFAPLPGLNQWVFAAGVLDNSTGDMSLYVNGSLASSLTTTSRPLGPLDPDVAGGLAIGAYPVTTFGDAASFDGLIDEVQISNTALTPSQFLDATSVPEPASIGMMTIAAGCLLSRKTRTNRRPKPIV
jgi:Concanavalin A-like lectin/glucanases superfamily